MSLNTLPDEILLGISEYGNVTPNLNPEYIYDEIQSIDPNFPWRSELTLEQSRANNNLYQQHRQLLHIIPCDHVDVLLWDTERSMRYLDTEECNIGFFSQEDINDSMRRHGRFDSTTDPRRRLYCNERTPTGITRALELPLMHDMDITSIRDLGYTVIIDGKFLVIPLSDHIPRSEIDRMLSLAHPRTNTTLKEGIVIISSDPEQEVLNAEECIDTIRQIIDITTIDDVITWNIGELIRWLKDRRQYIRDINDPGDLNELDALVTKHSVHNVGFYPHNLVMSMSSRYDSFDEDDAPEDMLEATDRSREMAEYFRSKGLQDIESYDDEVTVNINTNEEREICRDMFQNILKIRMTKVRFNE